MIKLSRLMCSITLAIVAVSACAASGSGSSNRITIAPLDNESTIDNRGMTRDDLDVHLRRFADRYMTRIAVAVNTISEQPISNEERQLLQGWKTASYAAVVDVAIGPDAVTNLLDMMTLTMLSRMVVEDHWIPEVLGPERAADLLPVFVELETDIWTIADAVLTEAQQTDLAALIAEWHNDNPQQYYPWYVRLDNFSGQRAASLNSVKQSGGLLNEVARVRETAEELQVLGERTLFYLQRAPMIASAHVEYSASNALQGPRITRLLEDTERLARSLEDVAAAIEQLPDGGLAAANRLIAQLTEEQSILMRNIATAKPGIQDLLTELRPSIEAIERTVVGLNALNAGTRPLDINEYQSMVTASADAASELRLLIDSAQKLLDSDTDRLLGALTESEAAIMDRMFLRIALLILVFFFALLAYRYTTSRWIPARAG